MVFWAEKIEVLVEDRRTSVHIRVEAVIGVLSSVWRFQGYDICSRGIGPISLTVGCGKAAKKIMPSPIDMLWVVVVS